MNSAAMTWALARDIYSFAGQYWIVPMGLLIGLGLPVLHWLALKAWPSLGRVPIVAPLIALYMGMYSYGNTSWIQSTVAVALVSQLWLRRYRAQWYNEWNFLLGAALDSGSQAGHLCSVLCAVRGRRAGGQLSDVGKPLVGRGVLFRIAVSSRDCTRTHGVTPLRRQALTTAIDFYICAHVSYAIDFPI